MKIRSKERKNPMEMSRSIWLLMATGLWEFIFIVKPSQGVRVGQAVDGDHAVGGGDCQETQSGQERGLQGQRGFRNLLKKSQVLGSSQPPAGHHFRVQTKPLSWAKP
ncbi:hypothetical protein EYF80_044380 [Liparis tanakae]|uniref:Uncharacterized protein n=1 Tax=Liparis tanakae TaxID=230148 RepID=A0A4Z2FY18_9TELE|nr:hypothetical protein EYF80_044380 [Liparis tanakae]